jgi:hypothetical protein
MWFQKPNTWWSAFYRRYERFVFELDLTLAAAGPQAAYLRRKVDFQALPGKDIGRPCHRDHNVAALFADQTPISISVIGWKVRSTIQTRSAVLSSSFFVDHFSEDKRRLAPFHCDECSASNSENRSGLEPVMIGI